ncbi:MAG TPA: hypothetical protein VHD62_11160 [Opitutaceae bacterium]|nr:hypothetical protein [Opitutaceae bacterium]
MSSDQALAKLDLAKTALAECKTVLEAKQIADAAAAARVYLERTNASVETVNRATEIRLLAERQMGEFLKTMPKHPPGPDSKQKIGSDVEPIPTLAEIGITKKQSATAQKLAGIPAPEFHERVAVAKASGGKLSTRRVLELSPEAKRAGEEAAKDSEGLWRLKSLWRKTSKKDRAAFLEWVRSQP